MAMGHPGGGGHGGGGGGGGRGGRGGGGGGGRGGGGGGKGGNPAQSFANSVRQGFTNYISWSMANEIAPAAIDRIGQFLGERIREPAPGADPHAVAGLIRPVLASLIAGLSIHEVVQASGIPDEKQARMTAELETYMSFLMEAMQQGMEGTAAVEYANAKAMILRQNPSFEALVDRLPVEMQQMLRPFLTLLTHDERRDGEFKALRRFIVNMGQMQELARLLEAAAERNRLPLPDGRSFVELYPVLVRGVNDANRAQYDAVVGRCADEVMPFLRGLAPHRVRPAPGQAAVNFLARTTRTITQHVQGFANNPGPAIDALGNAAGQMTGQIETLDRRIVVAGRYTFTPERVAEDWAFLAVTGFLGRLKWAMSCPDGHPIGFWAALFGTPPAANNGGAPPAP